MSLRQECDSSPGPAGRLLTPGEVGDVLRVDAKTVTRWAAGGLIDSIKTPGGHYRIRESVLQALLEPARTGTAPRSPHPAYL